MSLAVWQPPQMFVARVGSNMPIGYCAVQTVGRHFDPSGSFLKWDVVMKGWFRFFESSTIVVTVNH